MSTNVATIMPHKKLKNKNKITKNEGMRLQRPTKCSTLVRLSKNENNKQTKMNRISKVYVHLSALA